MTERIIDALCPLLGVKNTAEFTKAFGVANGTLSNLNNCKSQYATEFAYKLALAAIQELSEAKRKKISRKMRNKA